MSWNIVSGYDGVWEFVGMWEGCEGDYDEGKREGGSYEDDEVVWSWGGGV